MTSIADILIEQGRVESDRRRRSGERWGSLATSLGQIPATIAAERERTQDRALQQRRAQTQDALAQEQLTQAKEGRETAKTQQEREQQLGEIIGANVNPETQEFNLPGALNLAQQKGYAGLSRALVDYSQNHDAKQWQIAAAKATATAKTAPEFGERDPAKDIINKGTGQVITLGAPKPKEVTFGTPAKVTIDGKLTTARPGSDDKWYIGGQPVTGNVQLYDKPDKPTGDPQQVADVKDAIAGMKAGTLPPLLPGRASKEYVEMLAEAKRQNYDLASAATDWVATQKHIASLNSTQQTRLNQSIGALPDLLDSVDDLGKQWKAGRFPLLNKGNLAGAKNGLYGKDAAKIANKLEEQIADVVADLGNVYMGGNSPTDHALELASKSLNANWDSDVLHDMVDMAKKNVIIRQNSIRNVGVAGASEGNPYAPPAPTRNTEGPRIGDVVTVRGQRVKITKVNADGTFEGEAL